MKRTFLIFALIAIAASAFAQLGIGISLAFPREFKDPCNSAAIAGGQTYFNVDMIDTLNDDTSTTIFPIDNAWTYVSTDAGGSWLSPIAMTNIGGVDYADTWQSSRTNAASGAVEYYFKCETESTLTTEAPDNVPTSFPLAANKSATIGDATGDELSVDGHTYTSLDITNFRVSWDTDEFFFRVNLASGWKDQHQEGWFPVTTYYHILIIPLLNNESTYRDSLFFGVVVGNVNIVGLIDIHDGIYKFWSEDDTPDDYLDNFERIGDLNSSPSNPDDDTDFSIRVPISTLTSNGWGTWPNSSRAVGTGCATAAFWIESLIPFEYEYVLTDVTKSSGMICKTHNYNIGTNTPPTLLASSLVDYNRDTTWINLDCEYTDADNNLPTMRQLTIDDGSRTVHTVGSLDHSYDDGSDFGYTETYRCEYVDSLKYKWDFTDGATGLVSTGWQYAVVPTEIALDISGGSWTVAGDIGSLDTVEMSGSDAVDIVNIGNCPLDLGLAVDSLPNYWQLSDHVNWDTTVVYAHFSDAATPPSFGSFTANDVMLMGRTIWTNGTNFGGGGQGISYCVDGANSEKLYMAFIVPRSYNVYGSQHLKISLWASSTLP